MCNSFCTITVAESAYTHPPGCFLAAKTFCQRDPQKKPSLRRSGRPVGQRSQAHAFDGRDHVRSTVERPAAGEARHRGVEALQPPILPARGACDWHVHHRGQRLILANGQWQDLRQWRLLPRAVMHLPRFTERTWLGSGFAPFVCRQTLVKPFCRHCAINDGRDSLICIKCVARHICILR